MLPPAVDIVVILIRCRFPGCDAPVAAARVVLWISGSSNFVRQRGLAVIATRGVDGAPQAALIGITATEGGELVFDTSRGSRKYRNLSAFAQVALVIGWDDA